MSDDIDEDKSPIIYSMSEEERDALVQLVDRISECADALGALRSNDFRSKYSVVSEILGARLQLDIVEFSKLFRKIKFYQVSENRD